MVGKPKAVTSSALDDFTFGEMKSKAPLDLALNLLKFFYVMKPCVFPL